MAGRHIAPRGDPALDGLRLPVPYVAARGPQIQSRRRPACREVLALRERIAHPSFLLWRYRGVFGTACDVL